ncbi:nucleotidyl transferase AbiEii/AbiGii toxin family protein [Candidatus Woesearchaeota archaeon]|nr:nucleotidyl transferase AbiEii/AbiGii toxin family protein [Candidatus Woesearchaeota archaeon]
MHKDVAYAQDIIVEELYKVLPNTVIHGGTAIWRCYKGNRFSEDIDVYMDLEKEKIDLLFENLKKLGFIIIKKRIKGNSLYSVLSLNDTQVQLEAVFKKENKFLKEYETSQGLFLNVYTLTPEDLIKEKTKTYLKRRKIRDLYDVFFLLRYVKNKEEIKNELEQFILNFEQSIDPENLQIMILTPPIPTIKEMKEYIERWVK